MLRSALRWIQERNEVATLDPQQNVGGDKRRGKGLVARGLGAARERIAVLDFDVDFAGTVRQRRRRGTQFDLQVHCLAALRHRGRCLRGE
jgi:hypothetical protein